MATQTPFDQLPAEEQAAFFELTKTEPEDKPKKPKKRDKPEE